MILLQNVSDSSAQQGAKYIYITKGTGENLKIEIPKKKIKNEETTSI